MTCKSCKSLLPRGRSFPRALLPALVVLLCAGCFQSPRVDPNNMVCQTNDNCLPGYTCVKQPGMRGSCKKVLDSGVAGGADASAADGAVVVGNAIDGGHVADVASWIDGASSDGMDVVGIDSLSDAKQSSVSDTPTVQEDSGTTTAEVGRLPDGADAIDPARAEVADVPLGSETGPDVPLGSGGVHGTGGGGGAGGVVGSGGTSSGGTSASGGTIGSGGIVGTGGAGTGGASGAGGSTAACQGSATQCAGNSIQTCASGQWGTAVACGTRQTCTGPVGTAKCTCNIDPVCTSVGNTCASQSTLAICSQDAQACFYESTATTCTNGACTGVAGAASCCTNACAVGATQCQSSTTLQTCAIGSNGCTAFATATCSIAQVCERCGTASCADPNWNEWPLPNSQVDVTAGAPNLESYTDNGDGTVTDNITGLMWQQAVPTGTYTWADAVAYCPTLTLAGYNDWRLPSPIELVSIVDFGQSNPSINGTYFPSTPSDYFWSSSPRAGSASEAWYVHFGEGGTGYIFASGKYNVRCAR